ncbi:hypothetical protein [Rhizobium leguminosarum]|uniref:hypothetical protein n=1 Tax=Rhizobium leguminosarum TaxID=384 RepID=UPI0021B0A4AE|nr:hypothetical protein [Rhizobium leguminosarum]
MLKRSDHKTSSAMSGTLDEGQALAALVLWKSGHFDSFDIGRLLAVGEDAVCRTLQAARHIARGGGAEGGMKLGIGVAVAARGQK